MNQMIDLVACTHDVHGGQKFLFKAPAFSCLEKGDRVIVNTQFGDKDAYVVCACTVRENTDQYDMIIKCSGAKEPLKRVLAKVMLSKFDYEKGESEHE